MASSKAIIIKHNIPGRLRVKLRGLLDQTIPADALGATLEQQSGVTHVRVNAKCGSVVVGYTSSEADSDSLLTLITELAGNPQELNECPLKAKDACGCPDVERAGRRFGLLSAVGGAVLFSEQVLGLTIAQSLFSPLGLVTAAFAVPLVKEAIENVKNRKMNLEGFLAGGIIAATIAGEALTAFEILWITAGAELVTSWITERSRRAISDILDASTHHTFVLKEGVEVEIEISELATDDVVVLHTGEKVCVDGEVIDGEALVNEAPISGRADYIHKEVGDRVRAGTFVNEGVIYVRAEAVGDKTYLSRVLQKVEDSLEHRAPIELQADTLAENLIKVGFVATAGTLLVTASFWRAFTVLLVMACPCATVLSASTPVSAAINASARRNALIKGGKYLEEAGRCDTVCFDKTGTLTLSEPELSHLHCAEGISQEELLQLAVSAETHNHHPLAQAVKAKAEQAGVAPLPHKVCEYFMGKGMSAVIPRNGSEHTILVGNKKLTEQFAVRIGSVSNKVSALKSKGLTVVYVARDGEVIGLLAFTNSLRPEARGIIQALEQSGVTHSVMITGDEAASANMLAEQLGIQQVFSSVEPGEKADIIKQLQAEGRKVLMVGDGINDALALAVADVGVAMGAGGAEVAVESADIALASDDLGGLYYVHSLSRHTVSVINQNFWIATGSNLVGVVLGATGLLSPVMAGFLHMAHSLGVLANSSRVLRYDPVSPEAQFLAQITE